MSINRVGPRPPRLSPLELGSTAGGPPALGGDSVPSRSELRVGATRSENLPACLHGHEVRDIINRLGPGSTTVRRELADRLIDLIRSRAHTCADSGELLRRLDPANATESGMQAAPASPADAALNRLVREIRHYAATMAGQLAAIETALATGAYGDALGPCTEVASCADALEKAINEQLHIYREHHAGRSPREIVTSREADDVDHLFGLAHDMKSKIAGAGGFARLFAEKHDSLAKEKGARYLGMVVDQARALGRLVEQFEKLYGGESDGPQIKPERFDVRRVVAAACSSLQPRARRHEVSLHYRGHGQEAPLPVTADPLQIDRVLTNLIDNAIKYSGGKPGAQVEVSLSENDENVQIAVSDQGIGIPADELAVVFERCQRAAGADTQVGFGIGLATVAEIMRAHGGQITVESMPGHGSTFVLTLPKAPEAKGA